MYDSEDERKLQEINSFMVEEFSTMENFRHVYDVIFNRGTILSDAGMHGIEFSVENQNMELIEKKVIGGGPVGMINHVCADGVTRQYRRMRYNDLTSQQRRKYKEEFAEGDNTNEDYKLMILDLALTRKRTFVEQQEKRKRLKLQSHAESTKDVEI